MRSSQSAPARIDSFFGGAIDAPSDCVSTAGGLYRVRARMRSALSSVAALANAFGERSCERIPGIAALPEIRMTNAPPPCGMFF